MYMDDLIFSVDSLESAQTITNEAVSLFKSRGFKLVKWSADRDAMSVLSSLGPELLSASIRELDLCGEELALRWLFLNSDIPCSIDDVKYELHGFSDASNQAFSSVIYLRRLVNGAPIVAFIFGKSTIVQQHQSSWPIARKELTAAS